MKRKVVLMAIVTVLLSTLLVGFSAMAGEIQVRMKQRLPVITTLKSQGLVGEDNRGFLQYLKSEKPRQEVVDAENKDRLTVYKIIAERQNTIPDLVGKQRAAQIAGKATAGSWVQDPNGVWHQLR